MVEIEQGIPLPAPKRKRYFRTKTNHYPFEKMGIGDSFKTRTTSIRAAKQTVRTANRRLTAQFTAREVVGDDGVVYCRIWRIS